MRLARRIGRSAGKKVHNSSGFQTQVAEACLCCYMLPFACTNKHTCEYTSTKIATPILP
jgi:hypothetical protein